MDNLFEQMATISKAHAYDIVSKQAEQYRKALEHVIERVKTVRPGDAFCQSLADTCKEALYPSVNVSKPSNHSPVK